MFALRARLRRLEQTETPTDRNGAPPSRKKAKTEEEPIPPAPVESSPAPTPAASVPPAPVESAPAPAPATPVPPAPTTPSTAPTPSAVLGSLTPMQKDEIIQMMFRMADFPSVPTPDTAARDHPGPVHMPAPAPPPSLTEDIAMVTEPS